jgi:sugar phosphate isomerase/epimerase
MNILIDTYSYHFASDVWEPHLGEPRDILWILDRARKLGADGIVTADMAHFNDRITIEMVRDNLDGMKLELGTGGCDPAHMREIIGLCKNLGQRAFRIFLGPDVTGRMINDLKSVMVDAGKSGIYLAIENHQDLTSAQLLDVIKQVGSPYLGICLDTGNALGVMEHPLAAAEALAPVTYSTHIKEYTVYPKDRGYQFWGVPTGEGSCMVREQLEILFEKGPWKKEVPLNLEAAVELIDKSDRGGNNVIRAIRGRNLLAKDPPPDYRNREPLEVLVEEEKFVEKSLKNLKEILKTI